MVGVVCREGAFVGSRPLLYGAPSDSEQVTRQWVGLRGK